MRSTIANRLRGWLRRSGYRLSKVKRDFFFDTLLTALLSEGDDFWFVQIGANDGKSFDPLYQFVTTYPDQMRVLLLEPVREYFEELTENYAGFDNVTLLNIAIHNTQREMTIYRANSADIDRGELPTWAKGIASFDPNHHAISEIDERFMIAETVRCTTLESLLREHDIGRLDLLHIDTEGYDAEIVLNLDFRQIKPKVIRFEHGLTTGIMSKQTFLQVVDYLHADGYEIWQSEFDATAYLRDIILL